jgi:hypothetical protein
MLSWAVEKAKSPGLSIPLTNVQVSDRPLICHPACPGVPWEPERTRISHHTALTDGHVCGFFELHEVCQRHQAGWESGGAERRDLQFHLRSQRT